MPVVFELNQSQPVDQAVGRIAGDQIDLAARQGLISQRQVHFARRFGEFQTVGAGKTGVGEPIIKALQREVMEEVGLQVEVEDLLDVFEHVTPGDENYHFIILYYLCRPQYCDIRHNQDEVAEARWVAQQDLAAFKMPDGTRFILGKVFSQETEGTP